MASTYVARSSNVNAGTKMYLLLFGGSGAICGLVLRFKPTEPVATATEGFVVGGLLGTTLPLWGPVVFYKWYTRQRKLSNKQRA